MRPVTMVATHSRPRTSLDHICQQQDHPVLNTPEAATSKGRGAEGDDDVEVSFTLMVPLVPQRSGVPNRSHVGVLVSSEHTDKQHK
ncbi:hypothetical protein MRX96_012395 [Rhipicephalus microplus]